MCNVTHKGAAKCGVFALVYDINIPTWQHSHEVIYDQIKMQEHLIHCFQNVKITLILKFKITNKCKQNYEPY